MRYARTGRHKRPCPNSCVRFLRGGDSTVSTHFWTAIWIPCCTCGRAVGEIVPRRDGQDIAALLCGRVEDIEIREGEHPLAFTICGPDESGRMEPLPHQELLLFTPLNPETDHPYGVSLLQGTAVSQ